MKNLFVLGMLSLAMFLPGRDYKNTKTEGSQVFYSFELKHKISDRAGYFLPCYLQLDTDFVSYGNSRSRRIAGDSAVVKKTIHRNGTENRTIVIIGYDLSKMVDGNSIELRQGQILYDVGIYTSQRGRTYGVYSFNKGDKPNTYLKAPVPVSVRSNSSPVVSCPHCGKKMRLVPMRP